MIVRSVEVNRSLNDSRRLKRIINPSSISDSVRKHTFTKRVARMIERARHCCRDFVLREINRAFLQKEKYNVEITAISKSLPQVGTLLATVHRLTKTPFC